MSSTLPLDWHALLEPGVRYEQVQRPDDPRLGERLIPWDGDESQIQQGRPVLLGFPQDEGVRRNGGRTGAALAPEEIRRWLGRYTVADAAGDVDLAELRPLDLGNVPVTLDLEQSQEHLGRLIGAILKRGAIPVVLGGGHETAFGVYLGHVLADLPPHIVNIDAHLDVRPLKDGQGHSGSPFRQVLEHPTQPLPGVDYCCLGALPFSTSREHVRYLRERGGRVSWQDEVEGRLSELVVDECTLARERQRPIHLSIDADVVQASDVPGVSAPNPAGLAGSEVIRAVRKAGQSPEVRSLELVELNPKYDQDGRSTRWGALVIWEFLVGLGQRQKGGRDQV